MKNIWQEIVNIKEKSDRNINILNCNKVHLDISILIKDIETMNKWVDKVFYANPRRYDCGEREMWAGKVAFETGEMEKAKEYFLIAQKKSGGRCFRGQDRKYYNLVNER